MLGETQNQFSLTRAAFSTIERAKSKFLSVKTITVNQRAQPPIPPLFISLGVFRFEADKPGAVEFRSEGANGNVGVDAIQLLPAK